MYYYDVHVRAGKNGYSVGIKDTQEWEDFEMYGVDIKKVAPYLQKPKDVYRIDSVEEIDEDDFNEWYN